MNKCFILLAVLIPLTTPALAFEVEEIGMIQADFDGQAITQPTVLATIESETTSTAYLHVLGGGYSSLSVVGFSMDNARLGVDVTFASEMPSADTAPLDVTVTFSPGDINGFWTSEDPPSAASVTFTTLSVDGKEGRATGTFDALLCYTEGPTSEPDPSNCRPIQGGFDTPITIES